jgi:hypothetical protein
MDNELKKASDRSAERARVPGPLTGRPPPDPYDPHDPHEPLHKVFHGAFRRQDLVPAWEHCSDKYRMAVASGVAAVVAELKHRRS